MITVPINNLKDYVREYNQDIMLIEPLRPELEAFIKDNELGKLLREKIAELSGTFPKNDDNLMN